jgi:hypothetical protein
MTDQPLPTPGAVNVTPVARGLFLTMLLDREVKGIQTYGRSLETFNGRNAVRDALEEVVDAFQYLVQIQLEREAMTAENAALRARVAELEARP